MRVVMVMIMTVTVRVRVGHVGVFALYHLVVLLGCKGKKQWSRVGIVVDDVYKL